MKMCLPLFLCWFCTVLLTAQQRHTDDLFVSIDKSTHTYATKNGQELQLDVYQPRRDTFSERPAIIWMHGGGFANGSRDNQGAVTFMEDAARKGYVAVSISYRLTRKGKGFSCDASRQEKMETFRLASQDLWDAIYYIFEQRTNFRVDPQQIVVGGSSAGAEGALNAVYMKDWLYEGPVKYDSIQIAAVFSLAGAMIDVRYLNADNAVPAVLFHGTKDNLVPYATAPHHYCPEDALGYIWLDGSRTIADRLHKLNTSYLLYTFVDARHEIAGIPFGRLDAVFRFLQKLRSGGEVVQEEVRVR